MMLKVKEQKKSSIFSPKPKQPEVNVSQVYEDINELGRRIRVLEQRYNTLQNKAQITEQNVVSKNKQLSNEIKTTNLDIHELKNEISQIKDQILVMIQELKSTAKREEVKVLERYMNYWNPMKYVTHNEFEEMVREVIKRINNDQDYKE